LYTEEIYKDEKDIGIEMPIDRLIKIHRKTIILIGVSGCGKTRTCYDLCRHYWGLYFDCIIDIDFDAMITQLSANASVTKTEYSQIEFEYLTQKLIECLIAARLLVLQILRERSSNLTCFEWHCIQRSRKGHLITNIFQTMKFLLCPF
jgi:hypothetical protein